MDEKEKSNIMKNVLIIGLGRFGRHIAMQLNQLGHEIMAVDWKEERVDKVLPFVTNAQIGDSTNAEFLQSLGYPELNVMSRKNFSYVMVQIRWFIQKSRLQNGHLSVTQMIISLIIWRWMLLMRFLR